MKNLLYLSSIILILYLTSDVRCTCPSAGYKDTPPSGNTLVPLYPTHEMLESQVNYVTHDSGNVYTLRYTDELENSDILSAHQRNNCPEDESGLEAWHDTSTWPGSIPTSGDITLPTNKKIYISSCSITTELGIITVPETTELILQDADMELKLAGIVVLGKLRIGSETCRIRSKINIILVGNRPVGQIASKHKGIIAEYNGIMDIHGLLYTPTWTRLAKTIEIGDTKIFLQRKINWKVGQKVMIATTTWKDSRDYTENEVRAITDIQHDYDKGIYSITIDSGFVYQHYGGYEYQAEVGLLSHNIIIQGDESDSEPTGSDITDTVCSDSRYSSYPCPGKYLTGYGGHVMVSGVNAIGRFSGVEYYRMGQTNKLARYPVHFHLVEEGGKNSYVKDCSVHRSFFRCIVIHGTHNVVVSNNVAYDAIGHCIYLEDGIEENNTISYNLAAHVHFMEYPRYGTAGQFAEYIDESDNLVNPADTSSSPFYITNSYNRYFGCAAVGGWSGFAIVEVTETLKMFKDSTKYNFNPSQRPSLEFDGNTVHSSGWWWSSAAGIYVGGKLHHKNGGDLLTYNPGRSNPARDTKCYGNGLCSQGDGYLKMTNTKVFLCRWGTNHWGRRSHIINYEAYDTLRPMGILGFHYVHNLYVECFTNRDIPRIAGDLTWLDQRPWTGSRVGFEWYDVGQRHIVTDVTFKRCGDSQTKSSIWKVLTHSDQFVPEVMQATKNVKYIECDLDWLIKFNTVYGSRETLSGRLQAWEDIDGTLIADWAKSAPTPTILGAALPSETTNKTWWFRLDDRCLSYENDKAWWFCKKHQGDYTRGLASMYFAHSASAQNDIGGSYCVNGGESTLCPRIGFIGHVGYPDERSMDIVPNSKVTGPTGGRGWYLSLDKGSPRNLKVEKIQILNPEVVMLVIPYPSGTSFNISYKSNSWNRGFHAFTEASSKQEVRESRGDKYYFDDQYLWIRVTHQQYGLNFTFDAEKGLPTDMFEREGIKLPEYTWSTHIDIVADCTANPQDADYCQMSQIASPKVEGCESPVAIDFCAWSEIPDPPKEGNETTITTSASTKTSIVFSFVFMLISSLVLRN